MSTQAARSILFTHTSPQQGFRLLELSSELAELLSSKEAPTLELKSPATSHLPNSGTDAEHHDYVNLCTPNRTYRIRLVQSSNPIHILQPSDGGAQRGDITMVGADDEVNLVETVTTIAKCGSTLELHTPSEGFSAVSFLERMLAVYDGDEGSEAVGFDLESSEKEGIIRRVFEDVPVSRAQCEAGWIEICAFVLGRVHKDEDATRCCRRPSAKAKLEVWKRVLESAVLQGIHLDQQFLVSDLWKSVLDDGDEEPFPRALFEAIVRRVCEADGEAQGLFDGDMKWARIDKARCTRWVGETYLEARAPAQGSAIGLSEFLNDWKDHLPDSWRDEVALSKLTENSYRHPDQTTIYFVNNIDRHKIKKNISTDANTAAVAKKSRNWHELFRNQKRQKN
ncbi:hypothetical protein KXV22_000776 [Aspergillus fumigatus]|uniref:Sister chromatid cohesion protein Dcc1, putative n=2 Tax=Aspergillus fumigatus TaxID=746128 RepID=A4D9B9_ASPFU|nr:sister chromatid cohesion protein Dcc1, putative [Aspergillus fumigatus Af293]KAF4270713.1 hypothetical protein CNMCM8057_007685 [Aspergillus fumigatus]EBA27505.1 sister chromatid cohesion protein Dcc1, putative [Aspergillus fumigatus Af293]KAH1351819.1 hypothetical protein KXX14_001588 [Aspergillus fumigatus]KAH1395449.1 hypothetical protein KXX49_009087 [Aspergillus fumigatus]KAH1425629.1 hypothetical protein KXX64_006129 [Aspergillus fumigatus]